MANWMLLDSVGCLERRLTEGHVIRMSMPSKLPYRLDLHLNCFRVVCRSPDS